MATKAATDGYSATKHSSHLSSLGPINISSNLPPTLIFHGDADPLIPLDQSQRFEAEARKLGLPVELVVHPGGAHGWFSMVWDIRRFADWFDRYLRP